MDRWIDGVIDRLMDTCIEIHRDKEIEMERDRQEWWAQATSYNRRKTRHKCQRLATYNNIVGDFSGSAAFKTHSAWNMDKAPRDWHGQGQNATLYLPYIATLLLFLWERQDNFFSLPGAQSPFFWEGNLKYYTYYTPQKLTWATKKTLSLSIILVG